jgi:hypothetical protein
MNSHLQNVLRFSTTVRDVIHSRETSWICNGFMQCLLFCLLINYIIYIARIFDVVQKIGLCFSNINERVWKKDGQQMYEI